MEGLGASRRGLVLVTGADGFVGRTVRARLSTVGRPWRGAVRGGDAVSGREELLAVGDIGPETDWGAALEGVDAVVHLAARAHVLRERAADPLGEYRRVNVAGTGRLAREAADRGVRRFVFVSSAGVNGDLAGPDRPFTERDVPRPHSHYALSKWEAEEELRAVSSRTGMEVAILRPPLVYGPGVKANFLRLMRLVSRGLPLPFGSVDNRRSLLGADNLADAITVCLDHAGAAGETFLLGDGESISTPGLIRNLARALGRPVRLLPCPPGLLGAAARAVGASARARQLLGSLVVDDRKIRERLGWRPARAMTEGLEEAARWYRDEGRGI